MEKEADRIARGMRGRAGKMKRGHGRKAAKGAADFFKVIWYCMKTLWGTSPRYFAIRIALSIVSLSAPFAVITLTKSLMELLASGYAQASAANAAIGQCLALSLALLALNVLGRAADTLDAYYSGLQRDAMEASVKYRIMEKAAGLDLSFFDSTAFYNEVCDADRNSPLITSTAFYAMDLARYLVQFLVAFAYLFRVSPALPFAFVASAIPCTVVQIKQVEAIYGFQRQYLGEERKMQYTSDVLLLREFAKDVRVYNLFPFISRKFRDIWNALFSKKRGISLRHTRALLALFALPEAVAAASLFLLGASVVMGRRTIGDYTFLQGAMAQTLSGVYLVISSYAQLSDGKMRIQNYMRFLGFPNKVCENGTLELGTGLFCIEFKNVSFRYDDGLPWVLKNVSFSFHSRQKIALVGANGSGKSTVVKLLLRFYDPVEGQILVDGKDIREYGLASYRRHFSTVFQDYSNYAFNVRESVGLSDVSRANDEAGILAALRESGADAFVSGFPQGLDTYLTRRYEENGQELSGGQWQKMAIARACFRKADIYVLDEPSAALDAQSEDEVFRMFHAMHEGKGAVLISHRLSNVHLSDMILVLDHGTLAEQGTHKELMAADGAYAHMYRLQAEKYKDVG